MDQSIPSNTSLPTPEPLVKKVEDALIEKEEALLQAAIKLEETKDFEPLREQITFEDFMKLDLRVGEILEVEKVAKSKKLLKLLVDLGFEKRTIVSGIAQFYEDPQVLVGKKVTVVANLKPAKLMGIESQGMILAADVDGGIEVLHMENARPGDQVR